MSRCQANPAKSRIIPNLEGKSKKARGKAGSESDLASLPLNLVSLPFYFTRWVIEMGSMDEQDIIRGVNFYRPVSQLATVKENLDQGCLA